MEHVRWIVRWMLYTKLLLPERCPITPANGFGVTLQGDEGLRKKFLAAHVSELDMFNLVIKYLGTAVHGLD